MNAAEFAALVRDLRAAGIDFEPEIDLDRTIDDIASSLAAGRGDA